jgi:hypothetical protein
MKKRMFFMLLAVFAFIAIVGGFKFSDQGGHRAGDELSAAA